MRIISLSAFSILLLALWIGSIVETDYIFTGMLFGYFVLDKLYGYWKAELRSNYWKRELAKLDETEQRIEDIEEELDK